MPKTVAVIGCGVSGLAAIKNCKDYGLNPTCFEQKSDLGGLWFGQHPLPENPRIDCQVYKDLILNTWKHSFAYSDFPPKEETPVFQPWQSALQYLNDYADHFSLRDHIKFNRKVVELAKSEDYESTGSWTIKTCDATTNEDEISETFDFVIVASGGFSKANIPYIPGMGSFSGSIIHSGQFWDPAKYEDKTVIIVGGGISGVDLASVLAFRAKQIYLICPNGTWIIPLFLYGRGTEWFMYDHKLSTETTDIEEFRKTFENLCLARFDLESLGLFPERGFGKGSFAWSNDIDQWIHSGKIKVVRNRLKEFFSKGAILADDTEIYADHVILATGYNFSCEFSKEKEILPPDSQADLFENSWLYLYPRNQEKPTLFTLQLHYSLTSGPPVADLMSRAIATIISGKRDLPSCEEMDQWLEAAKDLQKGFFGEFPGKPGAYPFFLDLANFIGCYPDTEEIEAKSPEIGYLTRNGPILPYHYRLFGPFSDWDLATDAIRKAHKVWSDKSARFSKGWRDVL